MTRPDSFASRLPSHRLWLALALLVALGYLFGLHGDHIPRNGDELVYAHIARLTAATGHWLPLQSSYDFMRNTKPPVLFWQAMVAGGWGEHWQLFYLRLPSVFYSWCIASMVGLLAWKFTRDGADHPAAGAPAPRDKAARAVTVGAIAAIVYLSFFSSYRYGRPYLTSAPETFWLCGVFLALAWSPGKLLASRWKFPLLAGIAVGIGCLYKSFAMVVPVGFGLALCYQVVGAKLPAWQVWQVWRRGIVFDAARVLFICVLALAIFGLWFAVDPQPGEVWREFVVGENAGKFKSSPGYFKVAFSGGSGFLTILTGYFSNAGLLLPLTVGAAWAAFRGWRAKLPVGAGEKILWLWLFALALVFLLPNQRSTRYLIAAMPAVAVLVALYWDRIPRFWFAATLLFCLFGSLAMLLIAYGAIRATQLPGLYSPLFWLFVVGSALACLVGMFRPGITRPVVVLAGFAVLFSLAWVTRPFNGPLGEFRAGTVKLLQGQPVAVPSNFNGHFERYEFIIAGAKVQPYFAAQPVDYPATDVATLFKTTRYVLVQRRVGDKPCDDCRIIDERWDLRSRQAEKEGTLGAFRSPETFWFAKEYLVEPLPR